MLQLESLTTGYAGRMVGHQLSARLSSASLTALVGPNGVGKSTLLHTLTGRLAPLSGSLRVQGKLLSDLSLKERARRISVVLTQPVEFSHLTVRDVVELGRIPYTGLTGHLSETDHAIVAQVLSQLSLQSMAHRYLHTLSDGERQRVMVAKALAQQTPMILLDEPTAFLDYPSKVEMLLLLRNLAHEQGKTVLLSTHDLELALRLCDHLWLLSPDGTLSEGSPRDFADNQLLDRLFSSDHLQFSTLQIIEHSPFKLNK